MTEKRALIVNEDGIWHVRKVKTVVYQGNGDMMVYKCDEPIKNNCETFEEAKEALFKYLEICK